MWLLYPKLCRELSRGGHEEARKLTKLDPGRGKLRERPKTRDGVIVATARVCLDEGNERRHARSLASTSGERTLHLEWRVVRRRRPGHRAKRARESLVPPQSRELSVFFYRSREPQICTAPTRDTRSYRPPLETGGHGGYFGGGALSAR
jgi:hypothetical protein